jgi:hypothetical protein
MKWVEEKMIPYYPLGDFKVNSAAETIAVKGR